MNESGTVKRLFQRSIAITLPIITALCVYFSLPLAASCKEATSTESVEPRILRVAFPQVPGMTQTSEDGSRHGLVVDYLNEISKYTGWQYDFIDTDAETMIDKFLEGEFDLMGGTYYSPDFEQYFAYPDYNSGYTKSILLARRDENEIRSYDTMDLNGKTIGVYENAHENIRRLQQFLSENAVDCTLKYYSSDQLQDGNLYDYLRNGEVDLLLANGMESYEDFLVVASYNSQPHYIVTNVGNQEVLDGLNMALGRILDSNPYYAQERYEANYPDSAVPNVFLNEDELAYIRRKKTVTVALPNLYRPFIYLSQEDNEVNGIVPDILEKVSEFSGLEFAYAYVQDYADAIRLVRHGEADMAGFFLGSEADAAANRLSLTKPFSMLNGMLFRNKSVTYPSEGLKCAVLEGRRLPANIMADEICYFANITDALLAVNRGEVDIAYGLSVRMEQEIQEHYLSNVVPVTLINDNNDIYFALSRPAQAELLTILNKAIINLSAGEKTTIASRSLVSVGSGHFSLLNYIYSNPVLFVTISLLFLILILSIVIVVTRLQLRSAKMRGEMQKMEAESNAKSAFLSRMSHEIRTPMNAIVGLADLTNRMEDVPEAVRVNLRKLNSSSRYLLGLINDILDMSRISDGMLTLTAEPFSITQMLDELLSMMGADAERRGLTLNFKTDIRHPALRGDAIRLRQVLTNLLSNAAKFTPPDGLVELSAEEIRSDDSGATLEFHVRDNGSGIPPEDQARIFEAFEQSGTNYSKSQGTGLGLPISRSIVRLMGGELNLKSMPGEGSEFFFTVTLPYGSLQEESKSLPDDELLTGARFLLAEDNDLNAEIAAQLLALQGAGVVRVENGRLAVDSYLSSAPGEFQAILMDIQMPEMDGLDAARAIRSSGRADAASIPIIAMTANSFQEDIDAASAAGMNEFITKPLDVNRLFAVLKGTLHDTDATAAELRSVPGDIK